MNKPADSKQAIPSPEDRVRAIREREQKATKGPWHRGDVKGFTDDCVYREDGANICKALLPESRAQNLEFIAHARADIPYLLSLVEELKGQLAAYKKSDELNREETTYWQAEAEKAKRELGVLREALRKIGDPAAKVDSLMEARMIARAALTPEPATKAEVQKP